MEESKIRLNKYLSEIGYCSRRAGDKLIESGRVSVNNEKANLGDRVNYTDEIKIDNKIIEKKSKRKIYLALNKPEGIVCTTDTRVEKDNIIDFEHEEKQNRKHEEVSRKKVMKDVQSKISKSTLGDLDVLSELKNKIDDQQ